MALSTLTRVLLSTALIVQCSQLIGANNLRPQQLKQEQQQQQQQHQPLVYVIHDEHRQKSSSEPRSWNNQRLTPRGQAQAPRSAEQLRQPSQEGPAFVDSLEHQQALRLNQEPAPLIEPHAAPLGPATKTRSRPTSGGATKGGARKSPAASPRRRSQQRPPVLVASSPEFSVAAAAAAANGTRTRAAGGRAKKNLVCYYGTWAVYRPDAGKYPVENIDPFLCTHIIYGFTGLSYDNMIKPLDPWNDLEDNYGKGAMKRFTNLKRINPDLKALVAIGGWNEGSIKYSKMASEPEARAKFVASVVDFLTRYNFDGLDLDWEYPGARGGHSYDKQNFVRLLRELHDAFRPHGYLLTAAVSAGKWFIDPAYDIGQVSKYLDLINLMAYDYHGGWETKTGMNAPLFHSAKHDLKADELTLNVNWSVNYWLQQGAPAEKIMLGVGSYGRSFTLDKAGVNGINAPASQKGQAGPYTREPGSLGYNEICESFQRQPQSWTIVRDPDYLAPYAYNGRQWVGYDDMESLALKAEFAKSMGLGGMMMWSIETDDFLGRCHGEKYPLLNTVKRVLAGSGTGGGGVAPVRPPRPAQQPSTSSTRRPASVAPSQSTTTTTTPAGLEIEDEPAHGSTGRTTTSTTRRPPTTGRVVPPASSGSSSSTRKPITTSTTSTTTTTTIRPVRPTTSGGGGSNAEFVCRADGMFADPRNCRKFIRCVSSGGRGYSMFRFDCGPGTAFNAQQLYCDHLYNVPSCSPANQQRQQPQSQHWEQPAQQPQQQLALAWPTLLGGALTSPPLIGHHRPLFVFG